MSTVLHQWELVSEGLNQEQRGEKHPTLDQVVAVWNEN